MNSKKTVIKVIGLLLYAIIFPLLAGIIMSSKGITDLRQVNLIQFITFAGGAVITLWLIAKSRFSFKEIGLRGFKIESWMFYIFFLELIVGILGWKNLQKPTLSFIIILIFFVLAVGIFEELVFRGLLLNYLGGRNLQLAVILSSLFFGLVHLANLFSGANRLMTLIQVIYAVFFGFICALTVIKTKSIFPAMIWHSLHNFIALLTVEKSFTVRSAIIVDVQLFALLGLGAYLWLKIFRKQAKKPG